MRARKKILWIIVVVLTAVQFFQPERNRGATKLSTDFLATYPVPTQLKAVLERSCYDCHSNRTRYPWYSHVQPIGWMLARHISEGKDQLNFSEFGSYSRRRQASKLKGMENSLKDGSMPLWSYTLLHREARISGKEKEILMDWLERTKDSLIANR